MNMTGLEAALHAMGLDGPGTTEHELWELGQREAIEAHLRDLVDERVEAREQEFGAQGWALAERLVLLRTIDSLWVEHLTEIDDMRRGIGLRGYAQQDPLNEFKREAFALYDELRGLIRHQVASTIFRVTITRSPPDAAQPLPGPGQPARIGAAGAVGAGAVVGGSSTSSSGVAASFRSGMAAAPSTGGGSNGSGNGRGGPTIGGVPGGATARQMSESLGDRVVGGGGGGSATGGARPGFRPDGTRIGRNDPCWCGSGLKYKKCHGR
jgi:preprotein translocase subunit SecA